MANRVTLNHDVLTIWRWIRRRYSLTRIRNVGSMNDLPERLGSTIFVVGGAKPKWVVLECPCRCGGRIDVNLMKSRRPYWTLSVAAGRATLTPSLWMPKEKCGSHFFVRNNRVVWVR
jgi:hypothetical protein